MDPMVIAISVGVFLTFVALFAALRRGESSQTAMASRLGALRRDGDALFQTPADTVSKLRQRSYSGFPLLSAFLGQFKGSDEIAIHLERAGVPLRVGEYYVIRWGAAALLFLAPLVLGPSLSTLIGGFILAGVGFMLPAMWINGQRKKRTRRINAQLVDMLGMVSNSLKSGYGLMQSFEFAARQCPAPLSTELSRMLREANLGMGAEEALNGLGQRVDSADLDMVLTAVNIQRAVGGNLAEILDNVSRMMRERERIRGEIATLTAQQKMTAIVIGGLPVFMFAVFMVLNPSYTSLLFTEMAGRAMLGLALGLEVLGFLTIKRIMAIEI